MELCHQGRKLQLAYNLPIYKHCAEYDMLLCLIAKTSQGMNLVDRSKGLAVWMAMEYSIGELERSIANLSTDF